jgi:hypothetical protein
LDGDEVVGVVVCDPFQTVYITLIRQ